MPSATPEPTGERRVAALQARLDRTRRIAQLRSRVVATALGTFVLAFGLVAFDGSMGTAAPSSASGTDISSAPGAGISTEPDAEISSEPDAGFSPEPDAGASTQPLTTSQS